LCARRAGAIITPDSNEQTKRGSDAASTALTDPDLVREIIAWDVGNWRRAVKLWGPGAARNWAGYRALDLGAGGGGLSST